MKLLAEACYWLMRFSAWAFPPKTEPMGEDEIPVQYRIEEWTQRQYCSDCFDYYMHRFIEWLPDLVITSECLLCGCEQEVPMVGEPRE